MVSENSLSSSKRSPATTPNFCNSFTTSFADLQRPQVKLDGMACAAIGQTSLMALYDNVFSKEEKIGLDYMDVEALKKLNKYKKLVKKLRTKDEAGLSEFLFKK